ncbi:MAG: glycosyltransferase family 4 protein [Patescibacteria group bacterium]|nr:glycosyltransferase family 4 protein [Patescibacteria group bacterium]
MRIGIDMRMAGTGFGIGTYVSELVKALLKRRSAIDYRLFFHPVFSREQYEVFSRIHSACRMLDVRYYSLAEQLKLPALLAREKLDLVHFPNFNVPIFYPGKYVMTIHDLIHHKFPGSKKRNFYYRWGYRTIIKKAAEKASAVIAVSEHTKKDIEYYLRIPPEKISVVHEGVAAFYGQKAALTDIERVLTKYSIRRPYILAVGVWRRYKNLPQLTKVFDALKLKGFPHQLVLVGTQDEHYPWIKEQIFGVKNAAAIIATGKISDDDLRIIYQAAELYVNPSLSEGFGLTAIEAQASGLPVACSNIEVARETLGSTAVFFDSENPADMQKALETILKDEELRRRLSQKSLENSRRFSWEKTAELTEKIYLSALKIQ